MSVEYMDAALEACISETVWSTGHDVDQAVKLLCDKAQRSREMLKALIRTAVLQISNEIIFSGAKCPPGIVENIRPEWARYLDDLNDPDCIWSRPPDAPKDDA